MSLQLPSNNSKSQQTFLKAQLSSLTDYDPPDDNF